MPAEQDYQLEQTEDGYRLEWDIEDPAGVEQWLQDQQGFDRTDQVDDQRYVAKTDDGTIVAEAYLGEDGATLDLYPSEDRGDPAADGFSQIEYDAQGIVTQADSLDLDQVLTDPGTDELMDDLQDAAPDGDLFYDGSASPL